MNNYHIGSMVSFRGREWIVMPSLEEDVLILRPLTGREEEQCSVFLPLEQSNIAPADFPLPTTRDIGDFESARLLRDAARLLLRHGAGPFRSMGHLSFRPRPYQFVPLLMALRLENVRTLIADDVGIGKTIEAGLIARELLDNGEAKRIAVLCPPYLCDQWYRELRDKFNIDCQIVRTNTVARLERALPREDITIFDYYPNVIISIDFIKSDRYRHSFLHSCPDLVIVDEAHGCARPAGASTSQQHRYQLLSEISKVKGKNLILVTATPHSGIEESFLSLLGLLNPAFEKYNPDSLNESQRAELARHFIQRRRADVEHWLDDTPFPDRESQEEQYYLSSEYNSLFKDVYNFARELVKPYLESDSRRRVRYWAALALLRCVMSSPEAAKMALKSRFDKMIVDGESHDIDYSPYVLDSEDYESSTDIIPSHAVSEAGSELTNSEKRKLTEFFKKADSLKGSNDNKIKKATEIVRNQLKHGYKPIVFCRYIATAHYVAEELQKSLKNDFKDIHILAVTGELSEDEREQRIGELCKSPTRVLVATDCLSEGINLQDGFSSVIHYDLPWNPNRLEQREGRVDRFGQRAKKVIAVILYGADNPIDGAVLEVLLRKARQLHKTLGISVPIPIGSEKIMDSILKALFLRSSEGRQLSLFEGDNDVVEFHKMMERDAEKERRSRTRFAQHAIKPDEVATEIDKTDKILGDPSLLKSFIDMSCQRFGADIDKKNGVWKLDTRNLPLSLKQKLADKDFVNVYFDPAQDTDAIYISRNHPFTTALSSYIFDLSLQEDNDRTIASRCGVIRSTDVDSITTILVLRARYLLKSGKSESSSLAEECIVTGFSGKIDEETWLTSEDAERLLDNVKPTQNITHEEKIQRAGSLLSEMPTIISKLIKVVDERAVELKDSHTRLSKAIKIGSVTVSPLFPMDILSVSIIIPQPNENSF